MIQIGEKIPILLEVLDILFVNNFFSEHEACHVIYSVFRATSPSDGLQGMRTLFTHCTSNKIV